MSFWDRYLAPGDIRSVRKELQAPLATPALVESRNGDDSTVIQPNIPPRIDAAHRARRQNALLFGGAAFSLLSLFITRRALRRRQPALSMTPNDPLPGQVAESTIASQAKQAPVSKLDGGFDAAEALGLATLNVCSVFMLATGAFAKYFDVADVEDLRDAVRKGVGYDVYAGDSSADKEIEGWIAEVLARKDVNEGGVGGLEGLKKAVAGKLNELVEQDKGIHDAETTQAQGKS